MPSNSFVFLEDHMGDDQRIADAARVSYNKARSDEPIDKLIDYMMKHGHTSPFEHVSFTFYVETFLFVRSQIMRHRTFKFNEISARYSEIHDKFWLPEPHQIRGQGTGPNKQVGDGTVKHPDLAALMIKTAADDAFKVYQELLAMGVAREQARAVLPQGTLTKFYMTCDLHNLMHFLKLRLDSHAQPETQEVAQKMLELAEPIAPLAFAAWRKHGRNLMPR